MKTYWGLANIVTAACEMLAVPNWTDFEHLYEQQQEMARYGQAARTTCNAFFLVAGHRNLVSANHDQPQHQRR